MLVTSKLILYPLAITLCVSLLCAQSLPTRIEIVVEQGEGAVNQIRRRSTAPPVVVVQQGTGQPLAGAAVVFTLPTEGATGDFGGERTIIVATDAQGRAAANSLRLNAVPGKVPILVTASYRGLTAKTVINQVSVVPPGEKAGKMNYGGGRRALIAVLLSIGAAAGGGAAYVMTQQKKDASSPPPVASGTPPIGITPGTGVIVGGR